MAIETQRLVLRAPDQGDVSWIAREIANPRVHQWLAGPPRPFREEHAVAWVRDVQPNPLIRLITRDGQRQGVVGIRHSDTGPRLGYWLAEAAWGQGIMTEAARALAEAFFQTHDGPLFSGWIDGNAGSQNVLAKLGFRETAVSPDYSRYHGRDVSTHWVELSSLDAMPPLKRVEAAR